MLRAGADNIDPRGVDTAVTENIGEFGNILFDAIKHAGEQVPQVMREHLVRIDIRFFTK